MISFPNCKVNLGLNITSKRSDGFHNIETIFIPVALCDALEILPSVNKEVHMRIEGMQEPPSFDNNLCIKAYSLLRAEYQLPPVDFFLLKKIPSGSGLGGGSADAAFTLVILNKIFELNISQQALKSYAAKLGSDCAFFIDNTTAFATGRGDELSSLSTGLEGTYITLVNAGIHINTAAAYANCKPCMPTIRLNEIIQLPKEEWPHLIKNDFEDYAFNAFPMLAELKQMLYDCGAWFALMSGSGSTLYALSHKPLAIPDKYKPYLIYAGVI
ncbi:MAG: 4-(cytidine 5'-diphospho)-2-C-methyl-D-erythritol kinase [Bacteroidetes bacterium]|nr:4-(cytidine 5'-diphospho)-2-C-methyl-D-erythritol kinase [Bacteroidota bacterium]